MRRPSALHLTGPSPSQTLPILPLPPPTAAPALLELSTLTQTVTGIGAPLAPIRVPDQCIFACGRLRGGAVPPDASIAVQHSKLRTASGDGPDRETCADAADMQWDDHLQAGAAAATAAYKAQQQQSAFGGAGNALHTWSYSDALLLPRQDSFEKKWGSWCGLSPCCQFCLTVPCTISLLHVLDGSKHPSVGNCIQASKVYAQVEPSTDPVCIHLLAGRTT